MTPSATGNSGSGSTTPVYRITNIRANANGLGAGQTLIPTQIVAF